MKLDKKDRAILFELEHGARKSLSEIGRAVGLPKQVVSYRIQKMVREGVIKKFAAIIDTHKLGYFVYRIYIRLQDLDPESESKLLEKISNWEYVIWGISTMGRWDLEILFIARNNIHASALISQMKKDLGRFIQEYNLTPSIINYHFKRRYLSEKNIEEKIIPSYGLEPPVEKIDETDFMILQQLSQDATVPYVEIGDRVGLSYNTVKARVRDLEKRGVIQAYRTWLDLDKIGRRYYKALISMKDVDEKTEKRLIGFCLSEKAITYLVRCTGGWDIEIESDVEDEMEFRQILVRFRNEFKEEIRDYDILHAYKELKMDYLPLKNFEELRMELG